MDIKSKIVIGCNIIKMKKNGMTEEEVRDYYDREVGRRREIEELIQEQFNR